MLFPTQNNTVVSFFFTQIQTSREVVETGPNLADSIGPRGLSFLLLFLCSKKHRDSQQNKTDPALKVQVQFIIHCRSEGIFPPGWIVT